MKKFLYITFTLLALSACKNTSTTDKQEKEGITILQDSIKPLTSSDFENEVTDDPNPKLVAIVKDALQKVDSLYKGEENWLYSYTSQDSIAKTTIKAGKFFNNQPYVVLHIDDGIIESLVEVYKIEKNRTFRKKLSYIQDFIYAVHDSIFDANGDGINDFNIDWWTTGAFGSSIIYIYLFDPKTEKFSTAYNFSNATFYPKEKIIRGVQAGFGGISPDYTTKGKTFIRTKTPSEYPERKEGELLKKVPEEYRDQKDWFLRYEEWGGELPFLELILKDRK